MDLREYPSKKAWAVLFVNRSNEKVLSIYTLKNLAGISSATCFNWDVNKVEKIGSRKELTIEVNAHASKLVYISVDGTSPEGMTLNGKIK